VDAFRALRSPDLAAMAPAEAFAAAKRLFPGGPSQDPAEFLPFVGWLAERSPRTVVEIGTESGGTHFVFGHALPTVELTVAVDLTIHNRMRLRRFHRPGLGIRQVQGSSRDPAVVERVEAILAGRPIDVLFIDGDHSYYGATEDYRLYSPLVRDSGVVAFHDIVPDRRMRTGEPSSAYAGEVPLLWSQARERVAHREFVASWEQEGRGIGAIEHDRLSWPFAPAQAANSSV
jgi:predicted O-methyltransferase YrrM